MMDGVRVRITTTLLVFVCSLLQSVVYPSAGQGTVFFRPGVLDQCCMTGMQWSNTSMGRCSGYPGPVIGIEAESQGACISIVEVCCLKQVGLDMCEAGKRTALESQLCAVRDFDPGSEQFRECCHCCQMGVAARQQSSRCDPPGLGAPCDQKFVECCSGRPSSNYTIPVLHGGGSSENSSDSESPSDQPDTSGDVENEVDDEGNNVDECALFPGQVCSHMCVDLPRGFTCTCPEGYDLNEDKRTCKFVEKGEAIDCSTTNPCEQRCVNRNAGAECQCYEGYLLNPDGKTCTDIDECEEGTFRCSPSQICINTKGGYSCLSADCPQGTSRNPRTGQCESDNACLNGFAFNSISRRCEDIDECVVERHSCYGVYEVCRNTNGSYACHCEEGFARSNLTRICEDVNECALGYDDCKDGERCENTNGGFACRRIHHCGTGYTLDEASQGCVDNDECQLGTHNCANGYVCQNMQGSFRCAPRECPQGYRFNAVRGECEPIICRRGMRPNRAGSCEDINECEESGHRCLEHQKCINTVGGYRCRSLVNCPPGYEATSNNGCQDVNECESGRHRCGAEQECVNRQGSYFCQCPRGLRHDATGRCIDVNECAYGAAICPSTSECVNTHGSYKCECNEGFISDENGGCLDIDECLADSMCQHECRNVQGSFFCTCNRGYQLREDKRSCEDIDECTQFRGLGGRGGVCGGRCINTPGSYRCECPEGWRLKRDGRSCEDIDECSENIAFCAAQQDSICINTRGSYKCPVVRCPEGFAKTTSTGKQNREFIAEEDGVVCGRMDCESGDTACAQNKTKTVAWQFLSLPAIEFVTSPMKLLNIRTVGYSVYPNLRLYIVDGNEERMFDARVRGDEAALYLLKPVVGPAEMFVTLALENRDFSGQMVMTRHITYVHIYVSEYHL